MKKELSILFSGLIVMMIVFASVIVVMGITGRAHGRESVDNRPDNREYTAYTTDEPGGAVYVGNNTNIPYTENNSEETEAYLYGEMNSSFEDHTVEPNIVGIGE